METFGWRRRIAYIHAKFFAAFKWLGMRDEIHGHGRLLASLAGGR
jgi:hypothetical protein